MKRKIIGSITLVCLLLFTLNTSALANVDNNLENYVENEPVFGLTKITEKDIYLNWLNANNEELMAQGYTLEQVQEIRNIDLENKFQELGKLSDNDLASRGYTKEDISIIQQYNGEPIYENSEILNVLASNELSGWYTTANGYSCSTKQIGMRYNWRWDRAPIVLSTDVAVVAWKAIDKNLGFPDASVLSTNSAPSSPTRAYLRYANPSTEVIEDYENVSVDIRGIDNTAVVQFPMETSSGLYVKSGYLQLVLTASNFEFNSALFGGNYGHTIISFTGDFTYDVKSDHSVTIGPVSKVSTTFADEIRIYTDGSWK